MHPSTRARSRAGFRGPRIFAVASCGVATRTGTSIRTQNLAPPGIRKSAMVLSRSPSAPNLARRLRFWPILAVLSLARPARAQSPPWLDWKPPPECPSAIDIERRVSGWLGGELPPDTDLRVKGALDWTGAAWEVSVEITLEGRSGTRRVAVSNCYDAAEFVAVAVVLAIDPSLASSVQLSEDEESESAEETPDRAPPERPSTMDLSPAPSSPPTRTEPVATRGAADGPTLRPEVSAAAAGATGVLPEPALGVELAAGVDIGALSLSAGGGWFPSTSTTVEQAVAPIDFSLVSGRMSVAYLLFGNRTGYRAELGPSLSLAAGALRAKQRADASRTVVEPWFSLRVGAVALVELVDGVSLFGELGLEVPLARPTFVLDDGTQIYQVGVGIRAALGLRFFFVGR